MALLDIATLDDALSQNFAPKLVFQMNRLAVLASLLPKVVGVGRNCAWDVEVSGASAAAYADGADASTFDTDTSVPATIDWARYRSSFSISGMAISAAQSSASPDDLINVIMTKADGCASKLLSVMNAGLYTGVGSNAFVGLDTALLDTGTYANIAKGTYTEFAGNVLANGGTVRDLTKSLLDDAERTVYNKCGITPNAIVAPPLLCQKFESLFDTTVRRNLDASELSMIGSLSPNGTPPPAMVRNLMGFYKGIPVFRDKDATAGSLYFLNTEKLVIEVLPQPGVNTATMAADKALQGVPGDALSGFISRIESLGKTGDAEKFSLKVYAQLKALQPGACAIVKDLPTS